jgi:hypothetical protein
MNKPSVSSIAERRAGSARLSLCVLAAIAAAVLLVVPAARATPPTPILTGTDPGSPGIDLSPFVHGSSTGVIISSFPSARLSAIRLSSETEGRTIAVYAEELCAGPVVAEGTADALDTTGIQVTVKPEAKTFISVKQTDPSGTSGCSNSIIYEHVKELPPPKEGPPTGSPPPVAPPSQPGTSPGSGKSGPPSPPRLRTIPGGIANDNTPLVTGSAPAAASVRIFTTSDCSGAPVVKGSAAQFASGLEVEVVNDASVAFYGVSVGAGGGQSRCSEPVYYVEDSTIPHTRITMGPASKTRKRSAIFRFMDTTGNTPGTIFLCKVDRSRWKQCSSPLHLRRLRPKSHVMQVKAIDPAGNTELKGAKRRFKVVPRL